MMTQYISSKSLIKAAVIVLVVVTLLWFNQRYLQISPQQIRDWLLSFGWYAPVIFIVLYVIRPVILFPASIISITGGLTFGAGLGSLYTIIGATGGAMLSFLIARKLGKNLRRKQWTNQMAKIQNKIEQRGLYYVLILRLLPIVNFDLISYVSGVSKVKTRDFFIGTFFGIIPGTFAYNFLGSSIVDGRASVIASAILLFALILFVSMYIQRKWKGLF